MTERSPPGKGRAFLAAGTGAALILAASFVLLSDMPMPPGDWLLLLQDAGGVGRYQPGAPVFAWVLATLELWLLDPGTWRWISLAVVLAGLCLLALPLARGSSESALVLGLGALSLWPWIGQDPSALHAAGYCSVPLLLGLAVLAGVLPLWAGAPSLLLLGLCSGGLAGPHHPWGELLLLAVLSPAAPPGRLVHVLLYAAGAYGVCCFLPESPIPPPWSWWIDVDESGGLHGAWLGQGLLAALALCRSLGGRAPGLRQPLFAGTLLAATVLAARSFLELGRHAEIQRRDERSLGQALGRVPVRIQATFLNLPLHVRPFLATSTPDREGWERLVLLATWDSGDALHVPFEPGWQRIPLEAPICRWTTAGFQVLRWQDCLELPGYPLARVLHGDRESFPKTVYGMLGAGRQTEDGLEAVQEDAGVRVSLKAGAAQSVAVALGAPRIRRFSDPEALRVGLSPGWFTPPWPLERVEASLGWPTAAGKRIEELRPEAWLPGYGPVFRLPGDRGGEGELLVRLRE